MFGFGKKYSVNADEFEKLMKEGYKLIDVRTPAEYREARIRNCTLADIYTSDFKKVIDGLDKNDRYLLYCRTGSRSKTACSFLEKWGFAEIKDLSGGIISWVNSGREILRN
jgi:rhodanese-related sulfurtransferase